jgi:hypothetical protein
MSDGTPKDDTATPRATDEGRPISNRLLAAKIARAVFEAGDEPRAFGGKTLRIQFMGGHWPEAEKPMGGFCEDALALCIERVLSANNNYTERKSHEPLSRLRLPNK